MREIIESVGGRLEYLLPYSPDFNTIENAFSKLKALLRKAAERSIGGLWTTIGRLLNLFTQTNARPISLPLDAMQHDRIPL
ncbi:DDE superfamily endonuclease [Rhizobium sp. PP-F2F-G20b]|nr:DDE superfamily endonuclease [Rhizobium sp. PP-F2F-G20b]